MVSFHFAKQVHLHSVLHFFKVHVSISGFLLFDFVLANNFCLFVSDLRPINQSKTNYFFIFEINYIVKSIL